MKMLQRSDELMIRFVLRLYVLQRRFNGDGENDAIDQCEWSSLNYVFVRARCQTFAVNLQRKPTLPTIIDPNQQPSPLGFCASVGFADMEVDVLSK